MAQTVLSMIKALHKAHPTKHVNIDKRYNMYTHRPDAVINYWMYIEDTFSKTDLTYNQLQILVRRYTH